MAHKNKIRKKPAGDLPAKAHAARAIPSGAAASAAILSPLAGRNPYFDSLRAIAILVMVVDHAASILLRIPLDYGTVRIATRISMPIFAILMGYLLATRSDHAASKAVETTRLKRLVQISMAAVATNLLYLPTFGTLDILVSLAACQLLFLLAKTRFEYFWFAILLFPFDPTVGILDYPLTVILSLVAQGMVISRRGFKVSFVSAAFLTVVVLLVVEKPSLFIFPFIVPATLLVGFAKNSIGVSHPWLTKLGQHPLMTYVVQYYVLFAVAALIGAV